MGIEGGIVVEQIELEGGEGGVARETGFFVGRTEGSAGIEIVGKVGDWMGVRGCDGGGSGSKWKWKLWLILGW